MKTLAWIFLIVFLSPKVMAQDPDALRQERDKLTERGMWREALDFYTEKLLPISDDKSDLDLRMAVEVIRRQNVWGEFDSLVERAVATHPGHAMVLIQAAASYGSASHSGRLVAGEFERGGGRGMGRRSMGPAEVPEASAGSWVNTSYRDRVRSLQLFREAVDKSQSANEHDRAWEVFSVFQRAEAWKLQTLTPIETLPEWGEPGPEGGTEGAPWAKDGPVLYEIPASWEAAKNDGERWRFALAERARLQPESAAALTLELADFSNSQFGTETLASFGWWRQQDPDDAKGILEMDTLAEDECLAKTSDGVRRFKLPADQHFIALYRSIMDANENAGDALVQVFLNRRQYAKAREVLQQTIAKHGPGTNDRRKKLLAQITGNWGRFEPAETVPAGVKPKLPLVFRNATRLQLTAAPVDMEAVLRDTLAYLKSNPPELDW
ncbi:hypothetical protein HQ447_17525, partial [bacterium]|nr:hypothetical protein [bacterium]